MKQDKYIAHSAIDCETETFKTWEEANKWLMDGYEDADEGFSEETMGGFDYIAEITHRSNFTETDKRENYHKHTDDCPEDCDKEEWPHNSDFDYVGKITLERVH